VKVSLLITTYNWPQALFLSIMSALKQTILPAEIIIADDGSTHETATMIQSIDAPIPIIHSWQEDNGFRAAGSRNRAIAKANGDYIIGIDGDMILEKHFIEDHLSCAQKGRYLQGSRVLLTPAKSLVVLENHVTTFSRFEAGLQNRLNALRLPWLSRILCQDNEKTKGIRSCNFSLFKEDIIKVNGFNEDFVGWGREDSEFVQRLYHNGVKRKNLKFSALQYHLYHDEGSACETNDAILEKTLSEQSRWCKKGIDQYIKGNE